MKKSRYIILAGLALTILGVTIVFLTSSQNTPPVDINLDQSGVTEIGGVYFDQIYLHNHGLQNVTVVVVIKNDLDNGPRMSDPVQICPGCTVTALVEEHQPPADSNQAEIFTNIILHPEYIRAEYLSTVLAMPIPLDALQKISWVQVAAGLVMVVYGFRLSGSGKPKRAKTSKSFKKTKK